MAIPGVRKFRVRSGSRADVEHIVTLNHAGGASSCTCEGNRLGHAFCTHMKRVEADPDAYLEVDPTTLAAKPGAVILPPPVTKDEKPLPMLAKPWTSGIVSGLYAVEEKFDGHRMMVRSTPTGDVLAWSRTGKDCKHKMGRVMLDSCVRLPSGVYDGELMNPAKGGKSYNVSHLTAGQNVFVVFDVLELMGRDLTTQSYDTRRRFLEQIFDGRLKLEGLALAHSTNVDSDTALYDVVQAIWERRGEGVIVKHRHGRYYPGKRTDEFAKIKQCETAVLTIYGWAAGTTSAYNVALLVDDDGNKTKVKCRDDATRARVNREHEQLKGRRLRIEYHERTPDGSYRHPRWDRLEDE